MKIAAALLSIALAGCMTGDDTDLELEVATELSSSSWSMTATVTPGYDRHFRWDMRVTPPTGVVLGADETRIETVDVEVWTTESVRSRFAVEGTARITNTGARAETLGYVDVFAGDGPATVRCPSPLPVTVAAGETVTCRYHRVLSAEAPGTVGLLAGGTGGAASTSAPYRFDGPAVRITDWDRFVEIMSWEHVHGVHVDYVDAGATPRWTARYSRELGPYPACAPFAAPDEVILHARDGLGSLPSGQVRITRDATVHGEVSCCGEPAPER